MDEAIEAIYKADVLIEAMGWIRRFRDKITVIKLGGSIMYVLIGVGVTLLVGCCGCGGFLILGGQSMMNSAMNLVGEQIKPTLQADPVVQEHV